MVNGINVGWTPPVGAFNFEAVVVAVAAAVAAVVIIFFNIIATVLYCVMIDVIDGRDLTFRFASTRRKQSEYDKREANNFIFWSHFLSIQTLTFQISKIYR